MKIQLNWNGPFRFRELILDDNLRSVYNAPGIYVWKQTMAAETSIIYVGTTTGSLWQRLLRHYQAFLSGAYTIPREARRSEQDWTFEPSTPMKLRPLFDSEHVAELAAEALTFVSQLEVYCALQSDSTVLAMAEKVLIYQMQPERNARGKHALSIGAECVLSNSGALERLNNGLPREQALKSEAGAVGCD